MREDVQQLRRQGVRPRRFGTHPRRIEGKAAVHLHDGAELGEPSHQGDVRRVPHLLVTGADKQTAPASDLE